MAELRVLARHWRLRGRTVLAVRHPRRLRANASSSQVGTVAVVACVIGLLLTIFAAAVAGTGWDYNADPTTAGRLLVPVLLGQIAVAGGLYLSMRTLPLRLHRLLSGLWLLPLAVTALLAGGAGRENLDGVLFLWGCTGLALALWVLGRFETGLIARFFCFGGPFLLLAVWSAGGPFPEATMTAGVTVTVFAGIAIALVPGFLIIRGVSDLPRVHRWSSEAQHWLSGGNRLLWVVGAKIALLGAYLLYAQWRFPLQTFVPRTGQQWSVALVCALLAILPMRLARHRTLDETRVKRIGQTVASIVGAAIGLAVCLAVGSLVVSRDNFAAATALTALVVTAVTLSSTESLGARRRAMTMLLTPLALAVGYFTPRHGASAVVADEITMTWLVTVLSIGATLALVTAAWLAWRNGELWWTIRAVVFVGVWIGMVTWLGRSGVGLAAVDIVLTALLVGSVVHIRHHRGSRIAAVEVLALCVLPVVVFYADDLLAGLPPVVRPWIVGAALVLPGLAAIWHHAGLTIDALTADHAAGLAGLGVLYGMVAACVVMLGTTSTGFIQQVSEAALMYAGVPLTILFIALLEGKPRVPRVPGGVATPRP